MPLVPPPPSDDNPLDETKRHDQQYVVLQGQRMSLASALRVIMTACRKPSKRRRDQGPMP